jgi:molecular chaperone DnaJ
MKDYYQILGVSPQASSDEIKKAFKNLAKKFHPDANKGNQQAEERFKEISEAYDVLGKTESRRDYDIQREGPRFSGAGGNPFGHGGGFSGFGGGGLDDLLRQFAGGKTRNWSRFSPSYSDDDGFESMFGGGSPSTATLKVPLSMACKGGQINVSGLPGGSQRVVIPAQTVNGAVLSVSTSRGPYMLQVTIEDEAPFQVKGNDIETAIPINLAQAVLGGKVKFRDPRGEEGFLTIPPGSQPNDILRLRGLGLGKGDLRIKLEVTIPQKLGESEKELFRAFASAAGLSS